MQNPNDLLLDIHVWIWLMDGTPGKLSPATLSKIQSAAGKGRITLSMDCRTWMDRALAAPGIQFAPMTPDIAVDSARLPDTIHGDPADRILIATARALKSSLVTRNDQILTYSQKQYVRALSVA